MMRLACLLVLGMTCVYTQSVYAAGLVSGGGGTKPFDRGASMPNDGKRKNPKQPGKVFEKPALPAAAEIRPLDTSKFDDLAGGLALSDDQKTRVADAKKEIGDEIARLMREQDASRRVYEDAKSEEGARAAAGLVLQTAQVCRNFDPNVKWAACLRRILSPDQWGKFRELSMKRE